MSSCLLVTWPLAAAYNESGLICLSSDVGCSCWWGDTAASASYLTIETPAFCILKNLNCLERKRMFR